MKNYLQPVLNEKTGGSTHITNYKKYRKFFANSGTVAFVGSPTVEQYLALYQCLFPVIIGNCEFENKKLDNKIIKIPVNIENLNLPEFIFDVIYYQVNSKYNLKRQIEHIAQMLLLCKNNGVLIIEFPNDKTNPTIGLELFKIINKITIWEETLTVDDKLILKMRKNEISNL